MEKSKESIVDLMVKVFENTNRYMASMSGMAEEEIEKSIGDAHAGMVYYMSAIYDKLDENDLLKLE
ncbi:MAG: hypothetical protein ACO3UU_02290 [Minisyncoccia bacterium]